MSSRQYLTTAIDFPNGKPHLGHVLEKVLADVCARWFRLRGDETRFQIGTDDHGIKIQQTAEAEGMTPQELLAKNIPLFQSLFDRLDVSYDCFMSTSLTEGHYETAQALWRKLRDNGYLEKRSYKGLYCTGCESFKGPRDLEEGLCPDHKKAPEEVSEENWFFALSTLQDYLKGLVGGDKASYRYVPEFRRTEVLNFLEAGLEDVSFSRPKTTLYWGVPVPEDEDQVMYVWCDNMTSYISTLKYLTEGQDDTWWGQATVTHVVGKDITRFHGLNWPAMLHAAEIKTPDCMLIHGFLTCNGAKMSKTTGNYVDPEELLEQTGGNPDPIRFYLSHEVPVGNDGDFSWERFGAIYDSKLRNELGNLLNRVLTMLEREGGKLGDLGSEKVAWKKYEAVMDEFAHHDGIAIAMNLADEGNVTMDRTKPWELEGDARINALSALAEKLRHCALMLLPFVPQTAQRISKQLGVPYADKILNKDFVLTDEMKTWGGINDWTKIGKAEILFEPWEE